MNYYWILRLDDIRSLLSGLGITFSILAILIICIGGIIGYFIKDWIADTEDEERRGKLIQSNSLKWFVILVVAAIAVFIIRALLPTTDEAISLYWPYPGQIINY